MHAVQDCSLLLEGGYQRSLSIFLVDRTTINTFFLQKCQKEAWVSFHRDECPVLQETGIIRPQILAVYRLLFWQRRKRVRSLVGNVLDFMEDHFKDYSMIDDRSSELQSLALAIHKAVVRDDFRPSLGLVWRLIPAVSFLLRDAASRAFTLTSSP